MALDLESPPKEEAEEPDSLLQLQGESTAPIKAEEAKAMAPFPNMGIDVSPPSASPAPLAVKEEEPSPKPSPRPAVQQFKTVPARPSPKPAVAAYTNPAVTSEVKPEPKAAPAPAAAAAAPARPAASNPGPPPFLAVGSKPPENVSASIIDDAAGAGNGGAEANLELNFTDMQFSLELSLTGDSSQQNAGGSGFDLTSFPPSDVMGGLDILSLDNYSIGGPPGSTQQQVVAPAFSGAAATTNAPAVAAPAASVADGTAARPAEKAPALAPALAPEPNMDDLFDLGGSSSFDNLNTDLDAGMGGVEGVDSSSFKDLFFDDGDTEMGGLGGEFDNAYFGLE